MSPMNNRLLVPRSTTRGLLDLVPGAAAAYSLRSLKDSYTAPVVTVRRSSDNAEEDFTATEVSDGTLAAFCGAGDGFVKQWWDQSGNARHASQATTAAQPKIVSSGAILLEDGKPALQFDGTNDNLLTGNVQSTGVLSAFFALKANAWNTATYRSAAGHGYVSATATTKGFGFFLAGSSSQDWLQYDLLAFGSGFPSYQNPRAVGPTPAGSDMRLAAVFLGPSFAAIRINGASVSTRASVTGTIVSVNAPVVIGSGTTIADFWAGTISEFVLYLSDVSSQCELLEGQIAWSYSV